MKYLFFAKLVFLSLVSSAQSGNYFLSHVAPDNKRFDNICFDIAQDKKGLLYFATQAGIHTYDGRSWDLVPGDGAVYSMQVSEAGKLYWSGAKGFGTLSAEGSGQQKLQMRSAAGSENIFKTQLCEGKIYYLNAQTIFIEDEKSGKISEVRATNLTGSFTGMFELFDQVYVNTDREETYAVNIESLVRSSLNFPLRTFVTSCARLGDEYVMSTQTNTVYIGHEGGEKTVLVLEDKAYAEASVIVSVAWVSPKLISLGTLRGGVIFVDPATGKTQEIVNYTTGLPDNEVFALMSDRNQNIWVAHDYGFTRISPNLPFRSFSHYPGLAGNILCALSSRNRVYVGTSTGLFRLEQEDLYDELVSYVNVATSGPKKKNQNVVATLPVVVAETKTEIQTLPEAESKRGGFFGFLKKKKAKAVTVSPTEKLEEGLPDSPPVAAAVQTPKQGPVSYRKEKRVQRVLRSTQYVYRKVKGIDSKVSQLLDVNGKLIAAGLAGAYEVNELEATLVLRDPIRVMFALPDEEMLIATTYEDEIRTIALTEKGWMSLNILNDVDDQINYIFQGEENELWLCAMDRIYRLEVENRELTNIQTINLARTNPEKTVGMQWRGETILANSEGFFTYARKTNTLVRLDSMPRPEIYFAQNGNLWFRDAHTWRVLDEYGVSKTLPFLNLFTDLRSVSSDMMPENLWLVSGNNELYRFYGDRFTPEHSGYRVFMKSITRGDQPVQDIREIEVEENKGLSFTVVQPDYISSAAVEFRYFLNGLNKKWSEWSSANNKLDFPYLPPGDYQLKVQSRNIFGKVEEMNAVSFEVLPPYWKRWWFYALEFFIFAGLVVLSFRLSVRYRIISRLLSLLTIILLIQFIQTVIGATFSTKNSPVADFFIQVIVAVMILPVEGYLRKLMLQSLDASGRLYRIIGPSAKTPREAVQKD